MNFHNPEYDHPYQMLMFWVPIWALLTMRLIHVACLKAAQTYPNSLTREPQRIMEKGTVIFTLTVIASLGALQPVLSTFSLELVLGALQVARHDLPFYGWCLSAGVALHVVSPILVLVILTRGRRRQNQWLANPVLI